MTVSVVLPAYNRAATIRPAIESVLRQTRADFELIVVDDGSSDNTLEVVRSIEDPRIRVIASTPNRGVSAARNVGIRNAKGTWVAFQDSDDEWLPRKLERQMELIEQPGQTGIACYCGMVIVGGLTETAGRRTQVRYIPDPSIAKVDGQLLETLISASLASTQTLIVRRDMLLEVGGFDEQLPALVDWDCVLRLARKGTFMFVDDPLVIQRFSDNSITRDSRRRAMARARVIEKNRELLLRHPAVLARHYRSVAGELRRLGDLPGARSILRVAVGDVPYSAMLWLAYLYTVVAGVLGVGKK
jgi:glycosyltransferase involved in cell wall biosynthesis